MKHLWLTVTMLLVGCIAAPPPPLSSSPALPTALAPSAQDAPLARQAALDGVTAVLPAAGPVFQHTVPSPAGPVVVSGVTVPDSVFFDFGVSTPRPDADPALDALARAVQSSPRDSVLTVAGNTDATGTARSNQVLSDARARAVVAALVTRGVASERLSAIGFGSTRPIAPNDDEANRALNRRVEVAMSPSFAANVAFFTTIVPVVARQTSTTRPALARTPATLNLHVNRPEPIERNSLGPPVLY